LFAASAFAQRIDLHIDNPYITGGCPKHVHVGGFIRTFEPMRVVYVWERSDGSIGQQRVANFHRGMTHNVSTDWTLSGNHAGWMKLVILEPRRLQTRQVHFTVNCGSRY